MLSALFLIEHAYSHFLHEGLTWRMVLDWQMFCRRHRDGMDWKELEARVDEFGFRRFYDVFNAIGVETFNDNANENDNQGSLRSKSSENLIDNLSTYELSTDSK